ncbi:MAG: hypothetical protein U0Q14_06155 [Dermatophilaceae bacterium]
MDILAIVMSVVALVVACISAWYTRSQAVEARRQAAAAEESVRIERERRDEELADRADAGRIAATADVVVDIARTFGLDSRPMFRVVNRGPHEAVEILVYFLNANDGLEAPDTTRWRELSGSDALHGGASRSVPWAQAYETTSDFRAAVEWTDGRGRQHREFRVRA